MDSTVHNHDFDRIEDLFESENIIDLYFSNNDLLLIDDYFSNDMISDIPMFSGDGEPDSSVSPIENVSHDIPTDPKEWLVIDRTSKRRRAPRLYEFLIILLQKPHYVSYASYKDQSLGIFEVHQPEKVADLWQQVKNRQSNQNMTYDKFARAIRWYYKTGIMKKTNARYTFQFSQKTLEAVTMDENNNIIINYPM